MCKRIRQPTSHRLALLICLLTGPLLCVFPPCHAQDFATFGKSIIAGVPTGIIRDIAVRDETVFLGAENGLFQITGEKAKVFDQANSPLGKGYISNLSLDEEGNLWISEYGGGVFLLSHNAESVVQVAIPHHYTGYAWDAVSAGGKLYVSFLAGIIAYDLTGQRVISVYTKLNGQNISELFHIEPLDNETLVFIQNNDLLILNVRNQSLKMFPAGQYFPQLKKLTYALVNGSDLYIGGDKGVYRYTVRTQRTEFYPFSLSVGKSEPVEQLFADRQGNVWVAAGGLFRLDTQSQSVVEPDWYRPVFTAKSSRNVIAIEQTSNQELLFSSSQLGLVSIPAMARHFNLVTQGEQLYRNEHLMVKELEEGRALLASANGTNVLDIRRAIINEGTVTTALKEATNPLCLQELSHRGTFRNSTSEALKRLCHSRHSFVLNYEHDSFLIYDGSQFFVISSQGKILDNFAAPGRILRGLFTSGKELYVINNSGQLLVQRSKFSWNTLASSRFSKAEITCLAEGADRIWICTSGKGLAYFDDGTQQLEFVDSSQTGGSRYIRSVAYDGQKYLWIATNRGLHLLEPHGMHSSALSRADGVSDTDFRKNAVVKLGKTMLVSGDKHTYLFDIQGVGEELFSRQQRTSPIQLKAFELRVDNSSPKDEPEMTQIPIPEGTVAHLSSTDDLLLIQLSLTDFLNYESQRIEYQLLGYDNGWSTSSRSTLSVEYSDLKHGDYEFQARVVDPESQAEQPVTILRVKVPTPFWFSLPAIGTYTAFALILLCLGYRRYRTAVARRGKTLKVMVNTKQRALEDSNVSIKRLLEKKQTLFTNISHELRTPLALVTGPLQQIQEEPHSEDNPYRIEVVRRNAERVRCLVDQLMEIEQFESIRKHPRQVYQIDESISLILNGLQPLAQLKQQTVTISRKGSGSIRLHADSLEKIVSNLFSNSVKYTDFGGKIAIQIECAQLHLIFRIRDTGKGMTSKQRKVIFNRFTRLDHSLEEQGSGVGLALVKELVVANGGWITVESELGKGSCFTVHLPMFEFHQSGQDEERLCQPGADDQQAVIPLKDISADKPVILIVEDNEEMRDFLKSTLQKSFSCMVASNALQALEVTKAILPNLILTDFMMPGMNGIELARRVRQTPLTAHIPVILLTALADTDTRLNSLRANIDCCLTKPIQPVELRLRIENLLEIRTKAATQLAAQQSDSSCSLHCETIPDFVSERDQAFYVRFINLVEKRFNDEAFSRSEAASALAVSERQLNRKMALLFEHNFTEYLKLYRLRKAQQLIRQGHPITHVALEVGFSNPSYFSTCFREVFGITPTHYQNQNQSTAAVRD